MKDFFGMSWGMLSAILVFVSGCPYMWAIYKRTLERPVTSTLSIWFGVSVLLFVTSIQAGATSGTTLLPIFMGMFNSAVILLLSVRYGKYEWTWLDAVCVVTCIITIIIWQTTRSPLLGILGGVIVDSFACAPMIKKCWGKPEDEPVFPWAMFTFASSLNLLAVEEWEMKFWLFPVYMTTQGTLLVLPLILHRIKLARAQPA